jgi:hypothetical protein
MMKPRASIFAMLALLVAALAQLVRAQGEGQLKAQEITSPTGHVQVDGLVDKGGQVFNVLAYGARGNGMTDDGPAFQAATAALASLGGSVLVPAGSYLLKEDPFAHAPKGTHLILMQNSTLYLAAPWVIHQDGASVSCEGSPTGFPGQRVNSVEGCIIRPTAEFRGDAVIQITPASDHTQSDVSLSGLTFDMRTVPEQTVIAIETVSHGNFSNLEFTNSDGTRVKIVRGANATRPGHVNEHLTFRDIKSFGNAVIPVYGSETPSVLVDGFSGEIDFYNCSFQLGTTGSFHGVPHVAVNGVGILLEGDAAVVRFYGGYLGGFQTAVVVRNKSGHSVSQDDGTPKFWSFINTHIENYTTGFDISGTAAKPASYGTVLFTTFATPIGTHPINVRLGDYSEYDKVLVDNQPPAGTTPVELTAHAANNTIWIDSPDRAVTDNSGGTNLIFGRKSGTKDFWTNGPVISGLNTVPFSSTPTFDASRDDNQKITLAGDVTGSRLVRAVQGEKINFIVCQDAAGGHSFTWPPNVRGGMTVGSAGSTCSAQSFIFDGSDAYAISTGAANQ